MLKLSNFTVLSFYRARRSYGACPYTSSCYGGGGGRAFNELPDNCKATISKITIRYGKFVDSIQLTYRLSNGKDYTGHCFGGRGGRKAEVHIDVDGGERVTGVFGKSAGLLDQIGFVTTKGRIFGPYGGCGGRPFHVNSCHVHGIYGRFGALIDSIGFHCGSL